METKPFDGIDPLLQISVATLAKKIVEFMMVQEAYASSDMDGTEALKEMEDDIKVVKDHISKCRGAAKLYERMCWLNTELVDVTAEISERPASSD